MTTPPFDIRLQGDRKYSDRLKTQIRLHNNICFYCQEEVRPGQHTIDHVMPRSKGGRNTRDNIVLACRECNQIKGEEEDLDLVDIKLMFNKK